MSNTNTNTTIVINAADLCAALYINLETCDKILLNKRAMEAVVARLNINTHYEFDDDIFMCFKKLHTIKIQNIPITKMPKIPSTIVELIVTETCITKMPALPQGLEYLSCSKNLLTGFADTSFPPALGQVNCNYNLLSVLPVLNEGLVNLYCYHNCLKKLGPLPTTLKRLHCYNNGLTELPALPTGLQELKCLYNPLTKYPYFTNKEKYVYFEMPVLPQYADIAKFYNFANPSIIAYNKEQRHDESAIDMTFFEKVNIRTAAMCM